MRKSVCCCALLTACAALSPCASSTAFAGEAFGVPRAPAIVMPAPGSVVARLNAAPTGPGTIDVITGATIARPPLPPPDPIPSAKPEGTGDLIGAPAIRPGAAVPPAPVLPEAPAFVHPMPNIGSPATLGAPVAGRNNLFIISPAEVRKAVARGAQLICLDVRDKGVRDIEGHIAGDAHVPFNPVATFPDRVRQLIPGTAYPIVVYCSDGAWSSQAADILLRMGYRVYLMGAYSF